MFNVLRLFIEKNEMSNLLLKGTSREQLLQICSFHNFLGFCFSKFQCALQWLFIASLWPGWECHAFGYIIKCIKLAYMYYYH